MIRSPHSQASIIGAASRTTTLLDLCVVIPTFNRRTVLQRVLAALIDQTYPHDRYEIVIVDDGSTDGTPDMIDGLRKKGPDRVRITCFVQQSDRKGPAAANNLGLRHTTAAHVLFINDDVVADRGLIAAHMAVHREHPGHVVQGRVQLTSSLDDLTRRPRGFREYPVWSPASFFVTWNCSIARQALVEAGLFDERFVSPGWEDVELGYRLRRLGVRQLSCRDALGYHFKPDFKLSDLAAIRQKARASARNALLYARLHPTPAVRISTQVFWLPAVVRRMVAALVHATRVERINRLFVTLEARGCARALAWCVVAARYYWYLSGVVDGAGRSAMRTGS